MSTIKVFLITCITFITCSAARAQDQNWFKPNDMSVGAGFYNHSKYTNGRGLAIYLGATKKLYRNHFLDLNYRMAKSGATYHFPYQDQSFSTSSITNSINCEYNYRLTAWNIQFVPSVGLSGRYSKEKNLLMYGTRSSSGGEVILEEVKFTEFKGLSVGYIVGFKINYLINDYLAAGMRFNFQAYSNETVFNTLSFQLRYNLQQ